MSIRTIARTARSHASAIAAVTAAVAMAVVVAGAGTARGTYALWNDAANPIDVTISAGSPVLFVGGFSYQTHTYANGAQTFTELILVRNSGNTTLHHFTVTPTLTAGSPGLQGAVDTTFVSRQTTASQDWSTWLSDLTLGPGQDALYDMTTTLPAGGLELFSNQSATTNVAVTARAGTSWTVSESDNNFTQSVETYIPPVVFNPPPNENIEFAAWNSPENLAINWKNPEGLATDAVYQVDFNGSVIEGQSPNFYNPQLSLGRNDIPQDLWPPSGQTVAVTVTVVASAGSGWAGGPIASCTIWLTGAPSGGPMISTTNPSP